MTITIVTPTPAVRTFQPLQRVIGLEPHGYRVAAKLECGHVRDVARFTVGPVRLSACTCETCHPIEVLRGR
jgi:hypothetical protein